MRLFVFGLAFCALALPASAANYLETMQGEPVQAAGDHATLAKRAALCLAKQPGATDLTTDPSLGMAVATVTYSYSSIGVPWSVHSKVTVETKDGRFRIGHAGFEQKQGQPKLGEILDQANGRGPRAESSWMRVGDWTGSGAGKVRKAAQTVSDSIASCISAPASDW